MKKTELTIPEIALIAGTRAMLGAGAALLLADKLSVEQRRAAGLTLFLIGAVTTIPLVMEVFGNRRDEPTTPDQRVGERDYSFPRLADHEFNQP